MNVHKIREEAAYAEEYGADLAAKCLRECADEIELLQKREASLLRQVQVINPLAR